MEVQRKMYDIMTKMWAFSQNTYREADVYILILYISLPVRIRPYMLLVIDGVMHFSSGCTCILMGKADEVCYIGTSGQPLIPRKPANQPVQGLAASVRCSIHQYQSQGTLCIFP